MNSVPLVAIKDLVSPIICWVPAQAAPNEYFTYVDLSAIDPNAKIISDARVVMGVDAPSRARQLLQVGDVLVSTVRPNLNAVAFVGPNFDGATASTGFCALRPGPRVLGRYLFHWVRHPRFIGEMIRLATGASYPAVTDDVILRSLIPLPPLERQRSLSDVLDAADALRAKRRAALALVKALPASIFAGMFGTPEEVLHRWPVATLGEHLDFLTSGSRGWAKYYAENGDFFLRIENVGSDRLNLRNAAYVQAPDTAEARRTRVRAGDVLMSITADLGRTAVVPEGLGPAFINQHLSILRVRSLRPRFLSAYLASPAGQRQVQRRNRQAVKAGLNFDDIRALLIPLPPQSLQEALEERLAGAEALRTRYERSLDRLNALFASLQHRAFNGTLFSDREIAEAP